MHVSLNQKKPNNDILLVFNEHVLFSFNSKKEMATEREPVY